MSRQSMALLMAMAATIKSLGYALDVSCSPMDYARSPQPYKTTAHQAQREKMKMNPIEMYIQNGYEVMNALIENADITTEEYPTVNIQLKLPCGGVVFGGYSFAHVASGDFKLEGWEKGMTAIFRIMEVAGVNHWNKLKGSPVRAILKDHRIYAIAHFLEDKVVDYRLAPFQENACL